MEHAGEPVQAQGNATDIRQLHDLEHAWAERRRAIEHFSRAFTEVAADDVEADVAHILEQRQEHQGQRGRASASLTPTVLDTIIPVFESVSS